MPRFKLKNENPNRLTRIWRKIWKIELKEELIARKFDGNNARSILKWMYEGLWVDQDVVGITVEGKKVNKGEWIIQGAKYMIWSEKKLFKRYKEVPPKKYDDEIEFATNGMSKIFK